MFWVVFRSFAKKKEMVRGDKKSNRTTNLDFPSVLLNQGLTEANNNNTRAEETSFAFFTNKEGKKEEKGEEEENRMKNIAITSVILGNNKNIERRRIALI